MFTSAKQRLALYSCVTSARGITKSVSLTPRRYVSKMSGVALLGGSIVLCRVDVSTSIFLTLRTEVSYIQSSDKSLGETASGDISISIFVRIA